MPITGIISFISVTTAYLYGYKAVYTSNEKSASEENTIWKGYKINHQYSKSQEFEQDFKNYIQPFVNIEYTSLLKNLYEIQIAEKFSKLKDFFPYFSSCNRNFTISKKKKNTTRWCCECEKCAFVWLILSPFIDIDQLSKIFGENLFEKEELFETFLWLIWNTTKPFECVGTYSESKKAFQLALKKYSDKNFIILERIKDYL